METLMKFLRQKYQTILNYSKKNEGDVLGKSRLVDSILVCNMYIM